MSLVSVENVVQGRGQSEGVTPRIKFSRSSEQTGVNSIKVLDQDIPSTLKGTTIGSMVTLSRSFVSQSGVKFNPGAALSILSLMY